MDSKYQGAGGMLALGAESGASSYIMPSRARTSESTPVQPQDKHPYPAVDDHLVKPEVSREEIIRGRKISTMGANPEHADAHTRTDFVLAPHVKPGYVVATDLLTRVSQGSNFATDVSIRKEGTDPETGKRYLEELSFEIVNEQSIRDVQEKAQDLTARGVRRFVAIFVKNDEVREWSPTRGEFVILDEDEFFEDPLLIQSISLRALLSQAQAEVAVAGALIKKNNPIIAKLKKDTEESALRRGHQKGLDEGQLRGRRAMLGELILEQFGDLPQSAKSRIDTANIEQLRAWTKKLRTATSLDDVFG